MKLRDTRLFKQYGVEFIDTAAAYGESINSRGLNASDAIKSPAKFRHFRVKNQPGFDLHTNVILVDNVKLLRSTY